MGLFSRSKPKIKVQTTKKDGFSGWLKCSECEELIHANELEKNVFCCPKCDHHYRLSGLQRVALLADEGSFQEMFTQFQPSDPLNFEDTEKYKDRIAKAQSKTRRDEGAIVGTCLIKGKQVALGVLDFTFMAGSMGSVVGERLTCIIEYAIKESLPVVIVSASGGARMQESILSLMQMAKTSAALAQLSEKKLPYISVLTNPTTGGVTASFASLGDIIIAEPDALIAFAGPRVVEQTIGQTLPPGAQRSEFLLDKGMIDCVVPRHQLKDKLATFIDFLVPADRNVATKGKVSYGQSLKELPEKLKNLIEAPQENELEV